MSIWTRVDRQSTQQEQRHRVGGALRVHPDARLTVFMHPGKPDGGRDLLVCVSRMAEGLVQGL
jgi:hypothetical protein